MMKTKITKKNKSKNKSKSKSNTKTKTNKSKIKNKSIQEFNESLDKQELLSIKNNLLINTKNINISQKEILLNSGLFVKNRSGNLYSIFDPLSINTVCLSSRIFSILTNCLSDIILRVIKKYPDFEKLINKKFKRLLNVDKLSIYSSDITLQLKILKMIFNEKIDPNFNKLNKRKILNIIDELNEFRNLISHFAYKKDDYNLKKKSINKRSVLYQKNKLRNYNYIINLIKKSQYMLNIFYKNKDTIKLNSNLYKRNYVSLSNLIIILNVMCLIRERRKRLEYLVKDKKQLHNLAQQTLSLLTKKLNSNNDDIKDMTSRNIVNLILPRIGSDEILKSFSLNLSNKLVKSHCKNL